MNNENNNSVTTGNMEPVNTNNVTPVNPIENNNVNEVPSTTINNVQPEGTSPVSGMPINNDPIMTNNQNMNVEPIQTNVFQNDFTSSSPKKKGPNIMIILLTIVVLGALGYGAYYYFVLNKDNTSNSAYNNDVVEDENNDSSEEEDNDNNDDVVVDTDITLDDVMNAPVSPMSDFEVSNFDDGSFIITGYVGDGGIVVIPDGAVKLSAWNIFEDVTVTAIRLSDSVEIIEQLSFIEDTNLQYFISGSGLKEIGSSAFYNTTSLKYVELNEGLEKIEQSAFVLCTSLTELTLPRSVDDIIGAPVAAMSDDFVLKVYKDSYGEEFMLENAELMGVNYEVLD